ncbi:MAG: FKBP-type peptidyl-prolyl cis-trans isomerase [Bacteroidota bacterium]|nr:FKBP-type peptidyl-prolyl cis-trans isomerase [Bacteroidota bacterium]
MKHAHTTVGIILLLLILSIGCEKELKKNEYELLQAYIEENEIITEPTASGLYYIEDTTTTLENKTPPQTGDTVIITYKGYLLADTSAVFDTKTIDKPSNYIFKIDAVIEGWEEGIAYTDSGISAQLIIPSDLAYGNKQTGIIPPYSTLIFDITVLNIKD